METPGPAVNVGTLDRDERAAVISAAIESLSEQQREIVVAKVYDAEPFAAIAEQLGISIPTVKTHYLRALKKLHTALRHENPDAEMLLDTMYFQMYTNPESTLEMELTLADQLIGFGILDVAEDIVSAVYFVFDPDYGKRSLGTYAILRGIEWAMSEGYRYYHMGYLIDGHPKMVYKRQFGPGQLLDDEKGRWQEE